MLTTIPENILLDPIVILELVTLLGTFCYIARIVLTEHFAVSDAEPPMNLREIGSRQDRFEQKLLSFFGVGCLISQPKSALKQQRTLRRAYHYRY